MREERGRKEAVVVVGIPRWVGTEESRGSRKDESARKRGEIRKKEREEEKERERKMMGGGEGRRERMKREEREFGDESQIVIRNNKAGCGD